MAVWAEYVLCRSLLGIDCFFKRLIKSQLPLLGLLPSSMIGGYRYPFRRLLLLPICRRLAAKRYLSGIEPPEQLNDSAQISVVPKNTGRRTRRPPINPTDRFAELPNILYSREINANYVPIADNNMKLLDRIASDYGIEEALINEWTAIARATLKYCSGFFDGSRRRRKNNESLVNPALLLAYSGSHGELLLKKVAMGLALELEADFVEISGEQFNKIRTFLRALSTSILKYQNEEDLMATEEEIVDTMNGKVDRKALSSFLRRKLQATGELPKLKSNDFDLFARRGRTDVITMEYIEHCMKSMDGAIPRRVIYLHNKSKGIGSDVFRLDLLEFIETCAGKNTGTIVIMSDGSDFDPASVKEAKIIIENAKEEMPRGDEEDYPLVTPTSVVLRSSREEGNHFACYGTHKGDIRYNFLIDLIQKAPRFVITPPLNPQAALIHRKKLEGDLAWINFMENYKGIVIYLNAMVSGDNLYTYLVQGLPQPIDADMIMSEIPELQTRILSHNELISLCLSIPLNEEVLQTPISIITRTVESFFRNRDSQNVSFSFLQGTKLGSMKKPELNVDDLNKHEKRFFPCIVTPAMVSARFEDIGALDGVKQILYELISLRLERPDYFIKGILKDSVSGILLFGPPGTGKTMLAKAVAAQSGANFLAVNSSSIFDMYVGEGEKNVKALFTLARKLNPCIIFVDEVDALLDSRVHSMGRASRVEIINEFMSEWDGLLSNNSGVTIMAATNRPFVLDDAVLRRLPRRILIDLPDVTARQQILELLLKDDQLSQDVNLEQIARRCEHYSGSDLKNLGMAAAMRALRRFRINPQCQMKVLLEDFEGALNDVPASISEQMPLLKELRDWDKQFGEGNGRQGGGKTHFGFIK